MAEPSTKVTGGDDAAGVDPGGTHSTKPGRQVGGQTELTETVTTGDRNEKLRSPVAESNKAK